MKKSVSVLPEGEEKIISFISDFRQLGQSLYEIVLELLLLRCRNNHAHLGYKMLYLGNGHWTGLLSKEFVFKIENTKHNYVAKYGKNVFF